MRLPRVVCAALLALFLLAPALPAAAADGPAEPVIVLLRERADVDVTMVRARKNENVRPTQSFRHALRGFAAELTPGQVKRLLEDPTVDAIVPDAVVELAAQSLPNGVARIGARAALATRIDGVDGPSERIDADVAIIDTGIQPNHPDLNVVGGVNCTTPNRADWADKQGHGTHVAGTVGALDNAFGVVGAAPGVRLWSVRVFDASAFSRISWIVCGVDWVTGQRDPNDPDGAMIEVANMSLRDEGGDDQNCGYTTPDAEHRAICRSVAGGTTYVVAAGNDRTTTVRWRPASYDEVITVSAIADFDGRPGGLAPSACTSFGTRDVDDTFADFSNYGGDIDIAAPGVCVLSTIRGSGYGRISGTSMASPLVAGAAAVYKSLHPSAAPAEVRGALRAAGSDAWAVGTDRDSVHEPLLDMSSFGSAPTFRLGPSPPSIALWAGYGTGGFAVATVRGNGFGGDIALSVEGLPAGVGATITPGTLPGLSTGPQRVDLHAIAGTLAGTYDAALVARAGELEERRPLSVTVAVDGAAPVTSAPRLTFVWPAAMSPGNVALQLGWSGTDAETGIARFDLQEQLGAGPVTDVPLAPPPTATSRTLRAGLGGRLLEQVRAVDHVGNTGAWAAAPSIELAGFGDGTAQAAYRGGWRTASASSAWGGRTRYATARGASVSFRFEGQAVAWVATKARDRGAARLYVDGVHVKTIDLRASSTRYRQVVFARNVPHGVHTLKVVVFGTRGRPRVDVDGFLVLRR